MSSNKVNMGGLWKQTSKDGKHYLSGSFGNLRILVFPNEKKTADNQPDYNLVLAEKERPATPAQTEVKWKEPDW